MNFGFTEEQEFLRSEVRKFLDRCCPLETVRELTEGEEGFSRELWRQIADLGWLGLGVPERHGGAGLGWVDLTVVLEETGRTLFPSPLLATTLAAAAIRDAGSAPQRERWLPRLADGTTIGTLALLEASDRLDMAGIALPGRRDGAGWRLTGEKHFVLNADAADLFVVAFRTGEAPGALALGLLERAAPGVHAEDLAGMDLTRRMGRLTLDGARIADDAVLGAADGAWTQIGRSLDQGAAAVTAEAIGVAEGALSLTVDYAKQRQQFGTPIGRFQGVKHPLAEMYVDLESFKSLLYHAMWCLDEQPAQAPRAVSLAKAYASEALPRIGLDCVQLHGGIGYTWEYDAQLFLKRSKWVRPAFGDADHHLDRLVAPGER